MFSPKEFLRNLKDNSIKKKELRRYLYRTFRTADFYGWLFNPSKEQIVDFVGIQTEMFESITTSDKKMRCLIDVIDEHYDDLGRSTATFVWSICNFAVDTCNKQLEISMIGLRIKLSQDRKQNLKKRLLKNSLRSLKNSILPQIRSSRRKQRNSRPYVTFLRAFAELPLSQFLIRSLLQDLSAEFIYLHSWILFTRTLTQGTTMSRI